MRFTESDAKSYLKIECDSGSHSTHMHQSVLWALWIMRDCVHSPQRDVWVQPLRKDLSSNGTTARIHFFNTICDSKTHRKPKKREKATQVHPVKLLWKFLRKDQYRCYHIQARTDELSSTAFWSNTAKYCGPLNLG
jgi:hypothetical protein